KGANPVCPKGSKSRGFSNIHGKHPKITFPNDGIEIQTCCSKFENNLLRKINIIRQKIHLSDNLPF
ncbi:hypothetical protein, partial [Paraprevotella clara]|uniref:hypothetical protein n=1 Tax=Paraprevotella clara TaxID=454154 RepID=UPI004026AA18